MGSAVALVMAVAMLGACASPPGEQIATRIRAAGSLIVREVIYRPANVLDPPEVIVYLRSGTTEAQARDLWCAVVVPSGGSPFEGDTGVTLWNDSGTTLMAQDVTCPPSPS
jgi:ABC-type Fe3+-hydroxamate transport system substrate-binding protein